VQGLSTKALIDIYMDILLPTQDPRTYYSIVAGSSLELRNTCQVVGGERVYLSGSLPRIEDGFEFYSPAFGDPKLLVGGTVEWGDGLIDTDWIGILEVETNAPIFDDIIPQILLSDTPPYRYMLTDDATVYVAGSLPEDLLGGGNYGPSGSFGTPGANPMGIWVWDHSSDGTFRSNFNLNGTLYCPNPNTRLEFDDGNATITPVTYFAPDPDERYPAIVSKGEIRIRGWGTRDFNGLVYVGDYFDSDPGSSGFCYVDGMLIADRIRLRHRTAVRYRSYIQTQPAAPFAGGIYPTIVLHQRRYMYSLF
jgi:hypothetical protein